MLAPADRRFAEALLALAEQRFPDACAMFDSSTAAAPTNALAWVGSAECRQRDGTVLERPDSPSGYAFRSSYAAAASAYERALELLGPAQPALVSRLSKVLMTEANRVREGRHIAGRDTMVLIAYPSLHGDSLEFVPWPASRSRIPEGRTPAIERNLLRLRIHYRNWVRTRGTDPRARLGLAELLEKMGNISTPGTDETTALDEMAQGRLLSDSGSLLRLVHAEARMRLKDEDWSGAELLADSALRRWHNPNASDASQLIGLAAVTGRSARLESMLRLLAGSRSSQPRGHDGRPLELPPSVMVGRARLIVAALLGSCAVVREASRRTERLLDLHVGDARMREAARLAILERPYSAAIDCLPPSSIEQFAGSPDPLIRLQQLATERRVPALREAMRELARQREHGRAGDIAMNYSLGEARLLIAIGDTSAAQQRLDVALDGLNTQSTALLAEPFQAAAIPLAMELAARLAAARGDVPTWRRWSGALTTLWRHADPSLAARAAAIRTLPVGPSASRGPSRPASRSGNAESTLGQHAWLNSTGDARAPNRSTHPPHLRRDLVPAAERLRRKGAEAIRFTGAG
jgi:hypothetical protein